MLKSAKKILVALFCLSSLVILSGCSHSNQDILIRKVENKYQLFINGEETHIKGIGGMNNLQLARECGANAFRTWGGDVETLENILKAARENDMYVMQGIALTKDSAAYTNDEYKQKVRELVTQLATRFKDDPNLIIWGIGNEIGLGKANTEHAWSFVNELSLLIKSIDKRHLTSTVIAHNPKALGIISRIAPSLDVIGINSYGTIGYVQKMVDDSGYDGAYLITEWGPSGWWEMPSTEWKAPIEQTSEEKRIVYENRYNDNIKNVDRCIGSFVFLWGQKEERTPTWFSMFVENNVEGMPLKGEKTPMVEAMQRVWTGEEPDQVAPVIENLTINEEKAIDNVNIKAGTKFNGLAIASDRNNDKLNYVWEVLQEATTLGFGGSFEPRPKRVGNVIASEHNSVDLSVDEPGNYRLYVYVLDNTGFVATANVPFQIH